MKRSLAFAICTLLAASLAACDVKETKSAHADEPASTDVEPRISQVPWSPGGQRPIADESQEGRRIMNDPEQIAAGKQLYAAMNCVGCHFNGGGGMGPPLMDNIWIFGDSIENIAATIREGRPNGMPAFRGVLPDEQIWQVAAYVRSLSHPPQNDSAAQEEKK